MVVAVSALYLASTACGQPDAELLPWLGNQKWKRDANGPVLSLGSEGEFDDTHIFAPTVARENGKYPWIIRHAISQDGMQWTLTEKPVLEISQSWEHDLQIYPSVLKIDGVYLMWYASYLHKNHETTGIGFTASSDGINWHKHEQNPVLVSDATRQWESHYVSSHSVLRMEDGSFRIWYASRKKPPFHNLYFAINTAVWIPK